MPQALEQ